jgi:hypothetical protein
MYFWFYAMYLGLYGVVHHQAQYPCIRLRWGYSIAILTRTQAPSRASFLPMLSHTLMCLKDLRTSFG